MPARQRAFPRDALGEGTSPIGSRTRRNNSSCDTQGGLIICAWNRSRSSLHAAREIAVSCASARAEGKTWPLPDCIAPQVNRLQWLASGRRDCHLLNPYRLGKVSQPYITHFRSSGQICRPPSLPGDYTGHPIARDTFGVFIGLGGTSQTANRRVDRREHTSRGNLVCIAVPRRNAARSNNSGRVSARSCMARCPGV